MIKKCSIGFKERNFEYDVHSLVKAFFPGCKITMFYSDEEEHPEGMDMKLDVALSDSEVFLYAELEGESLKKRKAFASGADRKLIKNVLKQTLYGMLSQITGRTLPWGTLTGIRPVKIPLQLMEQGMKNADIAKYMRETYFTGSKKVSLAIATAAREKYILDGFDALSGYSLYIGIPFCPSICLYCSFGSHPMDRWGYMTDDYLDALFRELDYISRIMGNRTLHTVYIGGGTPTSLTAEQLERLLFHVKKRFNTEDLLEYTVEAGRPDTVTPEKMAVLKRYNVSRISINPQTMNDETLRLIGRAHTAEQVISAFNIAREAGFDNINMDIIAGLPGEGKKEVAATLEQIKMLHPDSLTVHSLALKRATRLNLFKEEFAPVSFENSEEIMDMAMNAAAEMQMQPYYLYRQKNMAGNLENTGYAKEGCFGIYNILIMEEKQTIIAAGSGAMSKFVYPDGRIERAENVKDLKNYIERLDEMLIRKEKYIKCS